MTVNRAVEGAGPARFAAGRVRASRLAPFDVLLPVALGLWAWGISQVNTANLAGFGLLPALPATYYLGIGLVLVSAAWWLPTARASSVRLTLHVIALVVMLYGTAPLVYREPRYIWLYKHIGVVQYIVRHGSLNSHIDIYQNWPGFFALVAWFDRIAGLSTPLAVAAWAQLLFNLLFCLMLVFATKALRLTASERWLAILLFEVSNWIAQDYFSPQAAGFVLSLGVLAIALSYCQAGSAPQWLRKLAGRVRGLRPFSQTRHAQDSVASVGIPEQGVPTVGVFFALIVSFTALVIVHELSPYFIIIQLAVLVIIAKVRPRWIVPVFLAIAIVYLLPRFEYVNRTYGILASLGSFFSNAQPPSRGFHLTHDELLVADSARLLSVFIWGLALLGIWRRLRAGRPVLLLAALAFTPFLLLALASYGGEALLRVQLFSLPWSACLAASALLPQSTSRRNAGWLLPPIALLIAVTLFLPAYFGSDDVNAVSPTDVVTSLYLDAHAHAGTIIYLDQNFPSQIGLRYGLFDNEEILGPGEPPGGFVLSRAAALSITGTALQYATGKNHVYLVMTPGMLRYALDFGLTTSTSLVPLERALLHLGYWQVFYRHAGDVVYELGASSA